MDNQKLIGALRFELRKDAINSLTQFAPIRASYHLKGNRAKLSTRLNCGVNNWDNEKQQAVYFSATDAKMHFPGIAHRHFMKLRECSDLNTQIFQFSDRLSEAEKEAKKKNVYTIKDVLRALKAIPEAGAEKVNEESQVTGFIQRYIDENKEFRAPSSLVVYKSLMQHIKGYQKKVGEGLQFSDIDYTFFESFQKYLLEVRTVDKAGEIHRLKNATIAKQLTVLKTFLGYARLKKIKINEDYRNFKIRREEGEVIALTSEEVQAIIDLENIPAYLDRIRSIFLFSCYTGLRYSDIKQLRREHIKNDEIRLTIQKTQDVHSLPLIRKAKEILAKYENDWRPLPVCSNQKANKYIKELCERAGINDDVEIVRYHGSKRIATVYKKHELISCHTGRRTFVTLSLEKGMSAEEVMACSNHKNYNSFKRYVKVTEKRKKLVLNRAWDEDYSPLKAV